MASTASSAAWTISSTLRSRTGRVIMPAWQKRQPRVQPRITSTETRLWTTSIFGTRKRVVGGGSFATMRLTTVFGASGMVGVMLAGVPSSQVLHFVESRHVDAGDVSQCLKKQFPGRHVDTSERLGRFNV